MPETLLLTLALIGVSAAGAFASLFARRRSRPTTLATFSDEHLLAALAALNATNPDTTAQPRAPRDRTHPVFVSHPASEMREPIHPKSVRSPTESDEERRRITVLIVEEINRRRGSIERY